LTAQKHSHPLLPTIFYTARTAGDNKRRKTKETAQRMRQGVLARLSKRAG
jgi:hypothetical protein